MRKLFQQKRHGGQRTASSGADLIASAVAHGGDPSGAVLGAVPAVLGTRQANRYSAAREMQILGSYAAGWPIPADVRHQLRRKYFHRTSQDVLASRVQRP